jgi:hypothetical protein
MTRKVIISETQLELLTNHIVETNARDSIIKRIKYDLDTNYEPTKGTFKKGGEYFEKDMILNKVDKEMMTPKSLFKYMKYKYKLSDDFIKQVIKDWYNGDISDNYLLSKNIPMK